MDVPCRDISLLIPIMTTQHWAVVITPHHLSYLCPIHVAHQCQVNFQRAHLLSSKALQLLLSALRTHSNGSVRAL